MGSSTELTEDRVLREFVVRDRREYPVMTITEAAERFPDVSRRTVQRRIKSLAEAGELRERQHGKSAVYWLPRGDGRGTCPACGGLLDTNAEYGPGYWCRACGSKYGRLSDGEKHTEFGRTLVRGSKMLLWWSSLPSSVRRTIAFIASSVFDAGDLPADNEGGVPYRPENLTINSQRGGEDEQDQTPAET